MIEIMKEYGEYILEAFVVICIALILRTGFSDENRNQGVFQMIGAYMPIENKDYEAYTDFQNVYKEESNKPAPEIEYFGSYLKMGVNKISDCIKATDYGGRELQIKVDSIKAPDGTELLDTYNPNTTEIDLTRPGIYVVTVSALDDINRSVQCTIQIPVNK